MKTLHVFLLALTLALPGCKKSTDPGISGGLTEYPSQPGTRWSYQSTAYQYNFRPSTPGQIYQLDTTYATAEVIITRPVRLSSPTGGVSDSITAMEFSIHEASDGPPMYSIGGLEYYESNEKGFFLHGYLSYGGTIAPKRSPLNQRFMFKGNAAPSISEFVWRITRPYEVSPLDTIRREYPPLMVLQFPLDVGTAWTFRGPGSYIHIDKKVIGRVDVAAAGNTYNCFEVQWLYDMDNDGVTDTDLTVIDCIASEGLIQRTIQFSNIVIATSESPEGIGLIDSRQVYLLTSNSSSSSARGTFF